MKRVQPSARKGKVRKGEIVHVYVLTSDGGESGWHVAFVLREANLYRGLLRSIPPVADVPTTDMLGPLLPNIDAVKRVLLEALQAGYIAGRDTLEDLAVEDMEKLEVFLAGRPWLARFPGLESLPTQAGNA